MIAILLLELRLNLVSFYNQFKVMIILIMIFSTSMAVTPEVVVSTQSTMENEIFKIKISTFLNGMYPDSNIYVTIFNKQILLTGQVVSLPAKNAIKQEVYKLKEHYVVFDQTSIESNESIEQGVQDSLITYNVNERISSLIGADSGKIKVVTSNAQVYLLGAATKNEEEEIISDVNSIQGVKKVISLLTLI